MNGSICVFAYSEVGYGCLKLLLEQKRDVAALFTHEDEAQETQWFRSCAKLAREHHVPVYTMEPKDPEMERVVADLRPDLILSLYYRKMIPMRVLDHAKLGAFNLHGGLLPKYRGRAPLNWAIINGETETGVTLHVMVAKADAGEIIDREAVAIGPEETAGEVALRVASGAVRLIARQIDGLLAGTAPRIRQDESQATYFGARTAQDGEIQWAQSAGQIFNLIRAVAPPFPGAFTSLKNNRLMVWKARIAHISVKEGNGFPGKILSLSPFIVAAGEGAVELIHFGFAGEKENEPSQRAVSLCKAGDMLGE